AKLARSIALLHTWAAASYDAILFSSAIAWQLPESTSCAPLPRFHPPAICHWQGAHDASCYHITSTLPGNVPSV
ncbi:MAG: hypothetical protein ABSE84_18570, partial [Isosphaeraceae bacterium]